MTDSKLRRLDLILFPSEPNRHQPSPSWVGQEPWFSPHAGIPARAGWPAGGPLLPNNQLNPVYPNPQTRTNQHPGRKKILRRVHSHSAVGFMLFPKAQYRQTTANSGARSPEKATTGSARKKVTLTIDPKTEY
jgi:hypothetical protein